MTLVERDKWKIHPPFTSPKNGFFFSADTIEELAAKIHRGHEFQRVPLTSLAETVAKWNSCVDKGGDPEFARGKDAPMHKIDTPPFYAATLYPVWHDSYGGLRINGRAQVIDMQGPLTHSDFGIYDHEGAQNSHGCVNVKKRAEAHRAGEAIRRCGSNWRASGTPLDEVREWPRQAATREAFRCP